MQRFLFAGDPLRMVLLDDPSTVSQGLFRQLTDQDSVDAVLHQRKQTAMIKQGSAAAAAKMANDLAHEINNPLQSQINLVYVASDGNSGGDAKVLAEELSDHILRLTLLVGKILQLPSGAARSN
jgi:nitrogen-specific signal transduction histidine kinase